VTKTPISNLAVQLQQVQGETTDFGYLGDIQSDQYNLDDGNTSSEVNELYQFLHVFVILQITTTKQ
jgi:hypothetical protein